LFSEIFRNILKYSAATLGSSLPSASARVMGATASVLAGAAAIPLKKAGKRVSHAVVAVTPRLATHISVLWDISVLL
jgi:hypothetical protein